MNVNGTPSHNTVMDVICNKPCVNFFHGAHPDLTPGSYSCCARHFHVKALRRTQSRALEASLQLLQHCMEEGYKACFEQVTIHPAAYIPTFTTAKSRAFASQLVSDLRCNPRVQPICHCCQPFYNVCSYHDFVPFIIVTTTTGVHVTKSASNFLTRMCMVLERL